MLKKLVVAFVMTLALVAAPGYADAAQQPQDGFVPVDQLPNAGQEQMPAAPLVSAAYAVAWGAIFFYVWTVWRRLAKVERELAEIRGRIPRR